MDEIAAHELWRTPWARSLLGDAASLDPERVGGPVNRDPASELDGHLPRVDGMTWQMAAGPVGDDESPLAIGSRERSRAALADLPGELSRAAVRDRLGLAREVQDQDVASLRVVLVKEGGRPGDFLGRIVGNGDPDWACPWRNVLEVPATFK